MFDFDASKLLIIGVVALVVIGPKDLPRVLRQVGQMVTKLRRMAGEFQGQFMDAMKEADLQDLQAEVGKLKTAAKLDVVFNPVGEVKREMTRAVMGPSIPAPSPSPERAALPTDATPSAAGPATLESVEPAHHTPALLAGAVHAVEPDAGDIRRRRILVPKRRSPGDRLGPPAASIRGRSPHLPPRRGPRP